MNEDVEPKSLLAKLLYETHQEALIRFKMKDYESTGVTVSDIQATLLEKQGVRVGDKPLGDFARPAHTQLESK